MIESFGNKIAKDIWEKDSSRKLPTQHHDRAKALLTILHSTDSLEDLKAKATPPALRMHKLDGDRKGYFAIDIHKTSGWRIIFKFKNGTFQDVSIEDYH